MLFCVSFVNVSHNASSKAFLWTVNVNPTLTAGEDEDNSLYDLGGTWGTHEAPRGPPEVKVSEFLHWTEETWRYFITCTAYDALAQLVDLLNFFNVL